MASSLPPHVPLSLLMTKDDFDCPEVLNAVNPHPVSGYAHGPIPNNNRGWIPQPVVDRSLRAGRPDRISAADIAEGLATNPPPNPIVKLNKENGLVCDVELFQGIMCGMTYNTQGELRKHLRNHHPGATEGVTAAPKSVDDIVDGTNALKRWVLTGGWRNAVYYYEPSFGAERSLIRKYCDALERIARDDVEFANKWGGRFHRDMDESDWAGFETIAANLGIDPVNPEV